jgi:uncharacterized DUF497 family protein
MEFEWNETKRETNIEKHGLDFIDAVLMFSGPTYRAEAKPKDGERRLLATGKIEDITVTAIYTLRGDAIRLISLRRARHGERKRYRELFHG